MKRRPLIAGNWKMHKTPQETQEFIESFLPNVKELSICDVLLIPPFTSLDRAGHLLSESRVFLGAQDMHAETSGAYTGAISPVMLMACGCRFVLAGHSERRHVFGDSDEEVNRKLHATLENQLRPILCVGESLDQRQRDRTELVLNGQLDGGLKGVDETALADIVIAYEPVWAIGTGRNGHARAGADSRRLHPRLDRDALQQAGRRCDAYSVWRQR